VCWVQRFLPQSFTDTGGWPFPVGKARDLTPPSRMVRDASNEPQQDSSSGFGGLPENCIPSTNATMSQGDWKEGLYESGNDRA
jgi:hypothetical protein